MQSINVLVIDDEEVVYDLLQHSSTHMEQTVSVDWCNTIADASQTLLNKKFDLVFLDKHIGIDDGIRWYSDNKDLFLDQELGLYTPVVVLTSAADQKAAINAIRTGVYDFVPKSLISPTAISRIIQSCHEKHQLKISNAKQKAGLSIANKQLLQKQDEIESFYQTVSHELKTPLTAISQFAELLADGLQGPVNAEQHNSLVTIKQCCQQMALYINDLLEICQINQGRFSINKSSADITKLINVAVNTIKQTAEDKKITVTTNIQNKPQPLHIDKWRIYQVLLNLLSNALKFTPEEGHISVNLKRDTNSASWLIEVSDTGCGISDNFKERIFEPYIQEKHIDYHNESGLGLGLAICKEIVDKHNGTLTVEDRPGGGSIFTIRLNAV